MGRPKLHRLSNIDPVTKTGVCRACGPVDLVLRNYSSGPSLACKIGTAARERAVNTNPKYSAARLRAVSKYQTKKRRERLVQRTIRILSELTMAELGQVLAAIPDHTTFGTGIDAFEAAPNGS